MLIHSSRTATNHMQGFLCFCFSISRFAKKKAPLFSLIANPKKAKNDDKVTFLERISEKYLVTFGNFCNFAADLANMFFMFIASGVCNSARSVDWID